MKTLLALSAGLLALLPAQAFAFDWSVTAKVTTVEVTYMPGQIDFKVDAPAGSCGPGTLLWWHPTGADDATRAHNADAILAVLITAQASGHTVTLFGNNNGCTIDYFYINQL